MDQMYWLKIALFSILDWESEDGNNYVIARYILEHYNELPGVSLTEISRQCNVSKAAVSRFIKELGLLDYIDLQMLIRSSNQTPKNPNNSSIEPQEDFFALSEQYAENLRKAVSRQPYVEELIRDIRQYRTVYAFGHLQASHIAYTLRNNLAMEKIFCKCTQSWTEQIERIRRAGANDLILVFSSSGDYFKRMDINMRFLDGEEAPRVYLISFGDEKDVPHPKIRKISLGPESRDLLSNTAMNLFINYVSCRIRCI